MSAASALEVAQQEVATVFRREQEQVSAAMMLGCIMVRRSSGRRALEVAKQFQARPSLLGCNGAQCFG